MKKNLLNKLIAMTMSGLMVASFAACGANTTTADSVEASTVAESTSGEETVVESTSSEETVTEVALADVEEVTASYLAYLESQKEIVLSADQINIEEIALDSTMKVKGYHNDSPLTLVRGVKITEAESGFEGVILQGFVEGEAVNVMFAPNDSGKLLSEDGIKLTSFLNTKQLHLF